MWFKYFLWFVQVNLVVSEHDGMVEEVLQGMDIARNICNDNQSFLITKENTRGAAVFKKIPHY